MSTSTFRTRRARRAAWSAAAIATASGLLLSACSAPDDTGGGGEQTGELVVWSYDGGNPAFAEMMDEFNAAFEADHPGVTVEPVNQPFGEFAQLFQATLTSGEGPCVAEFLGGYSGPAALAFADGLTPLNDLLDDEAQADLIGLESVSEGFDVGGDLYAVPFGLQPNVMYYNKALFAQAGLDPEAPPSTYEEFLAASDALKAAGIVPLSAGDKESVHSQWTFSWLYTSVGTQADSEALVSGDLPYTDDALATTLERLVELQTRGVVDEGVASRTIAQAADDFGNGLAAMFVGLGGGGFAAYGPFNTALGEENVGVVLGLEGPDGGLGILPAGPASAWGVTDYCPMKDVAMEYVSYITGKDQAGAIYDATGTLPGWKSLGVPAGAPAQPAEIISGFAENESFYFVHGLFPPAVSEEFLRQAQLVLAGSVSVDDALALVDESAR